MATNQSPTDFSAIRAALNGPIELVIGLWPSLPGSTSFDLFRADLSQDVAQEFRVAGNKYISSLEKNEVIAFDAGYSPDARETMRLPVAEFDDPDLVARILAPTNSANFDFDQSEGVAFHCFVVNSHGGRAAFLRKASSVIVTGRGLITGIFQSGRIDRITQPVLSFSPAVDMLIDKSDLWITNSATFRSLFRTTETMTKSVCDNVASICAAVPIANAAEFEASCQSDARMMAKLARVAGKPYLNSLTLTMIRAVIDNYDIPDDVLDADGRLVHANSPQRRWLILRILDDSYLESTMTNGHYEVNSKRQL